MVELKAIANGTDLHVQVSRATLDLMGIKPNMKFSYIKDGMVYLCMNRDSAKFEKELRKMGVKWKLVF